jgi:hypothetical protein
MEIFLFSALEVGLIPTTTLQTESDSGDLLLQRKLAALRTLLQWRVTHLLYGFQSMGTGIATVFVYGHGQLPHDIECG